MNNNTKDEIELETIKIFGVILPKIPHLAFRLTGNFLRFKSKANKAGKIFKKELIKQGLDEETASILTGIYMEPSHIRNYIQKQYIGSH